MLLVLLCMLFGGTVVFMYLEGWSFIDSLYVPMITLLTIGYGDMSPETDYGRFFCLFWLVSGCLFCCVVLGATKHCYTQLFHVFCFGRFAEMWGPRVAQTSQNQKKMYSSVSLASDKKPVAP